MRKEAFDLDGYEQMDEVEDIGAWIEQENPFVAMVQFRLQGLLTDNEMKHAILLRRSEWVAYMKEKAGLAPKNNSELRMNTASLADR